MSSLFFNCFEILRHSMESTDVFDCHTSRFLKEPNDVMSNFALATHLELASTYFSWTYIVLISRIVWIDHLLSRLMPKLKENKLSSSRILNGMQDTPAKYFNNTPISHSGQGFLFGGLVLNTHFTRWVTNGWQPTRSPSFGLWNTPSIKYGMKLLIYS